MPKLAKILLEEGLLDPKETKTTNYFVDNGHTHQIRSYPINENGNFFGYEIHYLDNENGLHKDKNNDRNFSAKFLFNPKTRLFTLISTTKGMIIDESQYKEDFDPEDIKFMEKRFKLIKKIIKLKTDEEFEKLKHSKEWDYEFETLSSTFLYLIGKKEFKKALINSETFEDGEEELDNMSESDYRMISFEEDNLEIAQNFLN